MKVSKRIRKLAAETPPANTQTKSGINWGEAASRASTQFFDDVKNWWGAQDGQGWNKFQDIFRKNPILAPTALTLGTAVPMTMLNSMNAPQYPQQQQNSILSGVPWLVGGLGLGLAAPTLKNYWNGWQDYQTIQKAMKDSGIKDYKQFMMQYWKNPELRKKLAGIKYNQDFSNLIGVFSPQMQGYYDTFTKGNEQYAALDAKNAQGSETPAAAPAAAPNNAPNTGQNQTPPAKPIQQNPTSVQPVVKKPAPAPAPIQQPVTDSNDNPKDDIKNVGQNYQRGPAATPASTGTSTSPAASATVKKPVNNTTTTTNQNTAQRANNPSVIDNLFQIGRVFYDAYKGK